MIYEKEKERRLENEHGLLFKLASAYNACTNTVALPVSMPGRNVIGYALQGYNDFEDASLDEIRRRIDAAEDHINFHMQIHERLLGCFQEADKGIRAHDRGRIVEAAGLVFNDLESYGALVESNIERLRRDAFLAYPSWKSHQIPFIHRQFMPHREFNYLGNQESFAAEIAECKEALKAFQLAPKPRGERREGKMGEVVSDKLLEDGLIYTKRILDEARPYRNI
jgi:hypothetical protein